LNYKYSSSDINNAIKIAIENGYHSIFNLLLNNSKVNTDSVGYSIIIASEKNYIEIVRQLLIIQ
jgi:hypothetical protein